MDAVLIELHTACRDLRESRCDAALAAGFDFLLLRAEAGEVDSELAEWWNEFRDADPGRREEMLNVELRLDSEEEKPTWASPHNPCEARIAARIHHPHVVAIYDLIIEDRQLPHFDGLSIVAMLRSLAKASRARPTARAASMKFCTAG